MYRSRHLRGGPARLRRQRDLERAVV